MKPEGVRKRTPKAAMVLPLTPQASRRNDKRKSGGEMEGAKSLFRPDFPHWGSIDSRLAAGARRRSEWVIRAHADGPT
jgi:hypothetical protein